MTSQEDPAAPSVLLEFRAENARSFKDEFVLSMEASAMAEERYVRSVPWRDGDSRLRVLPVAGVFGANASGKSNLLKVMCDMRDQVVTSFRSGVSGGGIKRWPFRLDQQSLELPSRYEVDLVLHGVRWEYGFELNDTEVISEWACRYPRGRAALLFDREGDEVRLGTTGRSHSRAVQRLLRKNALFLSTAAATAHPVLSSLYQWFQRNLRLADAQSRWTHQMLTAELLRDPSSHEAALQFLRAADLGITEVRLQELAPDSREWLRRVISTLKGHEDSPEDETHSTLTDHIEPTRIKLLHQGTDGDFEIDDEEESLGTLTWLSLAGPVLYSLATGTVLLADELDASLHPDLVALLVSLYQGPETNPNKAQLIFNSHDTTLMGRTSGERLQGRNQIWHDAALEKERGATGAERLLGRDQIWFTQKLNDGRTQLYPLINFKPRKQEAIATRYLDGWYGAKPIISPTEFETVDQTALPANA